MSIQRCEDSDFDTIHEIINDAAQAYRGVIPEDRWHDPYMSRADLKKEIDDGVVFWGYRTAGSLVGVMGIQDKGEVTLIRHAYVRTIKRNNGIGTLLLQHLEALSDKPILIGTWAATGWAVTFYQKNGYRLASEEEKNRLLKKYWSIPDRQVETSVVLANGSLNERA
jgi:N-acetylglutamate synthase-like GNAT family acetyltransferase